MSAPRVAVCTVVYNSADDLPGFLEGVAALDYAALELVVVDNASADGSAEVARRSLPPGLDAQVVDSGDNLGFAGGMNLAIRTTDAEYVLSLNADARPEPDFVGRMVATAEADPRCAAVAGRLTRPATVGEAQLDACGMHLSPTWRHFDRGSGQVDRGQFSEPERVFGATGAASLLRRSALEDVAIDGEIFLEEFHSFREDAELCFRFAERGWRVRYDPAARAEHRRHNLPSRRREMSRVINFHSLKNRFLLRAYHQSAPTRLVTAIPTLARDLGILLYVALIERSSIESFRWLWRNRVRIAERRRAIRARRTAPAGDVASWFLVGGKAP